MGQNKYSREGKRLLYPAHDNMGNVKENLNTEQEG